MRLIAPLIALTCLVAQPACKKGGGTGATARMPAAVRTYEALRWVPAEASYAFVGKRGADVSDLLRVLAEVGGIALDMDAEAVSAESRRAFGYDILSVESLQSIGIDTDRGAAIFSNGLSPTLVAALGDPGKLDRFVEGMRESGVSMQSQVSGGVEVFTIRFEPAVSVSWAVADGWILGHLELTAEGAPELGWFETAHAAAGALGGHPDFAAALEAAREHAPAISAGEGPPIVGVIRPGTIADSFEGIAGRMSPEMASIAGACMLPLRDASRALVAAGVADTAASGSIVVDLADPARLAGAALAAPAGWVTAREGAPLQVDVGLDVPAYLGTFKGCPIDAGELAGFGVRSAHLALHSFDDVVPSRGAAYADLSDDRVLRGLLRDIPGLRTFSKTRKLGDLDVVDVSVPLFIDATYHLSKSRAAAAIGEGLIETILAPGAAPAGELLHLDLRPGDIPYEVWDLALQQGVGIAVQSRRARTIDRLRRWERGTIDARLDGKRVVITAAGTRR